jgi:hypothetical protein
LGELPPEEEEEPADWTEPEELFEPPEEERDLAS